MTLSNIFIGKKVVQQAYLNNALIYQSNGWQTLPSTCTEVWDKELESTKSIKYIDTDAEGNLFALYEDSLCKYSSDGTLLFTLNFSHNGYSRKFSYLKITDDGKTIYTVEEGDVYRAGSNSIEDHHIYIVGYNKLGEKKSDFDLWNVSQTALTTSDGFTLDDKFFYLSAHYGYSNISNQALYKIDKVTNKLVADTGGITINRPYYTGPNITNIVTDNGDYLYIGSESKIIQVYKNNFAKQTAIYSCGDNVQSLALDDIGNLMILTKSSVLRFNLNKGVAVFVPHPVPSGSNTVFGSVPPYIDYAENVYYVYGSSGNSQTKYYLAKVSSDNTLIYTITFSQGFYNSICGDNKGNIYIYQGKSISNGYSNHIKKLMNLVKEN